MYNIVMFAYNEENNIAQCISNVFNNVDGRLNSLLLLANGCTDNTIAVAEQAKQTLNFEKLQIIDIEIGDKCNAWNHYIHTIKADADCHFFIDSDVSFTDNCFSLLFDELKNADGTPHIIAGYPLSGRNLEFYQMLVEERSCFFGNLYGASQAYIEMIRTKSFYLPIGLNWIDSFLTKAANTDIQFLNYNLPNRVIFKRDVGFQFESLSPFNIADIKLYKNRIARYELGKIQELYLDALKAHEWPKDMTAINIDILENFKTKTKHLSLIKRILVKKRLLKLLAKNLNT